MSTSDDDAELIIDLAGPTARIVLNRPAHLNALTPLMLAELGDVLAKLGDTPGIRCLVLTGRGRGFCAGADMKLSDWDTVDADARQRTFDLAYRIPFLLRTLPFPVIAGVNGVAAGAGISLFAAADFRIAADSARFTLGFSRLGLIPDLGLTAFLPELVGAARALELVLLDEPLSAESARDAGLVSSVVPTEQLDEHVHALAQGICALAPLAVRETKALLARSRLSPTALATALRAESEAQNRMHGTADFREGLAAYRERRPAAFRGL